MKTEKLLLEELNKTLSKLGKFQKCDVESIEIRPKKARIKRVQTKIRISNGGWVWITEFHR